MSNCCNCDNQINRDGSGQLERFLKALDPAYAPIDDRSIEDLLVFSKRYANQIRFYDIPGSNANEENTSKVTWSEFFRRDMAVIAASIAVIDLYELKNDYDEIRTALDVKPSYQLFSNLFDPILGIAVRLDKWFSLAIPQNPLHDDLKLAIDSNLKTQMQKIVAYEEGFRFVDSQHLLALDYSAIQNKHLWGLNENINADISIYQGSETADKIRNGALYVDDVFNNFYGFLKQLFDRSESYMQFAMDHYPAHQPHMALFIAFLKLFRLAQEQMNGLTERMLDFYYRDVLQLTAKPSIPDKAHVIFELAKDVAEFDIVPGTLLKAKVDAAGKDQVYITETDIVVNQAKVKELKTIFIEKSDNAASPDNKLINTIYARPVANSLDGFGAKFTSPNPKWSTFGKGSRQFSNKHKLCKKIEHLSEADRIDQADIGFAIASPQLVMQGGKRMLELFGPKDLISAFKSSLDTAKLEIWLTGEKGWVLIDKMMDPKEYEELTKYINKEIGIFNPEVKIDKSFFVLGDKIVVYLPVSETGIVPFDAVLHSKYSFKTSWPVIRVALKSKLDINENVFKSLKLTSLKITTRVGSINPSLETIKLNGDIAIENYDYHLDGLTKLVLQNDLGPVPPDQPFDPFTPYPTPNKSFYIGSDEIFNKNLGELAINIKKVSKDEDFNAYIQQSGDVPGNIEFDAYELEKREWTKLAREVDPRSFTQWSLTQNILHTFIEKPIEIEGSNTGVFEALPTHRKPIEFNESWTKSTDKGFIRLDNLLALPGDNNRSKLQVSQEMAQDIQIKEISVSYYSELLSLDPAIDQFFHLYPFGVVEIFTHLAEFGERVQPDIKDFKMLDQQKDFLLVDANSRFLPQFNFVNPYAKYSRDTSGQNNFMAMHKLLLAPAGIALDPINLAVTESRCDVSWLMLDAGGVIEQIIGADNQYSDGKLQEGMLFIGLENLKPLQSISMLFQFAEGSAENEEDDPPVINWSYLTYNEWRPLKAENIIYDGTYGFQTTGIIKIDTPVDASLNNTIITDSLIWFCASVNEDANRIPQLIDILTQAVETRFQDNNNAESHFDSALPAKSIGELSIPVAEVASVLQPFASFDGKHKEVGKEFYTRVSERLRHKGRAINAWDYEHLVLDRFPGIYKVKCITHTDPNCNCRTSVKKAVLPGTVTVLPTSVLFNGDTASMTVVLNSVATEVKATPSTEITLVAYGDGAFDKIKQLFTALTSTTAINIGGVPVIITNPIDQDKISWSVMPGNGLQDISKVDIVKTERCCGPQIAPGHVLLVPISNFKNRNNINPLQPKTGRRTLLAIQDYIAKITSPFVHVHVKNPEYEEIMVSFKVKFYSGIDKGYYIKKLNDEIVQYLTPWAFNEDADVQFNQKIYASSVINFIEERSYVNFITDFEMCVCCDTCCDAVFTGAFGTITGKLTDEKGLPIKNVLIKIKDLNKSIVSADDGTYFFDGVVIGEHILVAYFSLFNAVKKNFTMPNVPGTTLVVDLMRGNQTLSTGCGCDDFEHLLQNDANFIGDIVAEPCSPRSILVSVPHHIIIPYDEPPVSSPCSDRADQLAAVNSMLVNNETVLTTATEEKIVTNKPAGTENFQRLKREKQIEKAISNTVTGKVTKRKNG